MLIWQHLLVFYGNWIAWLRPILRINPPEEENDKISEDEEAVKKWNHMDAALFTSEYIPYEIKIKYKENSIKLMPEQEEMIAFLESVIDIDYLKKEIKIKTFAESIQENTFIKTNSTKGKNEADN